MAATEIKVQMQQRRDTAAGWTSANPVLLSGELGYETNTDKFKIGDGSTAWNSLAYIEGMSIQNYPIDLVDIADDAIAANKIRAGAVTTAKISDTAVTTSKLDAGCVSTDKLQTDCVTADKLADTTVTAGSYTAADITVDAQGRITAAASGELGTDEIADGSITTAKIANDAVTAAKLANTAVTAGSYTAADITVDAQGRITAAASGSVGTSEITDGSITEAKMASDFTLSSTGSYLEIGDGGGGVALTLNDGHGNANLTFNHRSGTPDQNGNAGRITVNTDTTADANMQFQVKSNVTDGTSVTLTKAMEVRETYVDFPVGLSFDGGTYVMDEYEEGTFTPEYDPNFGSWSPTYDMQNGNYIRIGDVCHFRLRLRTDTMGVSSASGTIDIAGLPFTARGTTPQAVSIWGANFPAGDNPYMAFVNAGTSEIFIYKMNSTLGSTPVRIQDVDFGDGTNDNQVYVTGSYQVA